MSSAPVISPEIEFDRTIRLPHSVDGQIESSSSIDPMMPMPISGTPTQSQTLTPQQILNQIKSYAEWIKQQHYERKLRSPSVFANPQTFSRPANQGEAIARIDTNIRYFMVNYLALAVVILIIVILLKPSFLLTLVVLAAIWMIALIKESFQIPFLPGPVILSGRSKMITLYVISGLLLFLFAGGDLLMVIAISVLVVVIHALLKNPPPQHELEADVSDLGQLV